MANNMNAYDRARAALAHKMKAAKTGEEYLRLQELRDDLANNQIAYDLLQIAFRQQELNLISRIV